MVLALPPPSGTRCSSGPPIRMLPSSLHDIGTCTGTLSRNRRVGQALGAGYRLAEAVAQTRMVAEGVRTTLVACALAERAGIEMPIAMQMREVLYRGRPPREAVEALMLRTLKRE